MEEQEYFNEAEYIRGFNIGYQVSKEFPEIGEILDGVQSKSDKLDGIKDGREQYLEDIQREKSLDKENVSSSRPEFLSRNRFDEDRSFDKDASEPDRDIDRE